MQHYGMAIQFQHNTPHRMSQTLPAAAWELSAGGPAHHQSVEGGHREFVVLEDDVRQAIHDRLEADGLKPEAPEAWKLPRGRACANHKQKSMCNIYIYIYVPGRGPPPPPPPQPPTPCGGGVVGWWGGGVVGWWGGGVVGWWGGGVVGWWGGGVVGWWGGWVVGVWFGVVGWFRQGWFRVGLRWVSGGFRLRVGVKEGLQGGLV